jgi:hypothetical protein
VGASGELLHYVLPLPFTYESTGKVTQSTNRLDPNPRSREVFTFHRPEELLRLVNLDVQLRGELQGMTILPHSTFGCVSNVLAWQSVGQRLSLSGGHLQRPQDEGSIRSFSWCLFLWPHATLSGSSDSTTTSIRESENFVMMVWG